jgi:hypothetical protein
VLFDRCPPDLVAYLQALDSDFDIDDWLDRQPRGARRAGRACDANSLTAHSTRRLAIGAVGG